MTIVEDRPIAGFAAARKAMIDGQLRPNGVNAEPVLQRMAAVAREDFVPPAARGFAYSDRAIALDDGHFLPEPTVHGLILQEAAPTAADKVLLVGCGSAYLAELLRPMVGSLTILSPAEAAAGQLGQGGPYSLLIVEGAVEHLPAPLVRALTADGRALAGIIRGGITRLAIGRRVGDELAMLPVADIGIPVLTEFNLPKGWSF